MNHLPSNEQYNCNYHFNTCTHTHTHYTLAAVQTLCVCLKVGNTIIHCNCILICTHTPLNNHLHTNSNCYTYRHSHTYYNCYACKYVALIFVFYLCSLFSLYFFKCIPAARTVRYDLIYTIYTNIYRYITIKSLPAHWLYVSFNHLPFYVVPVAVVLPLSLTPLVVAVVVIIVGVVLVVLFWCYILVVFAVVVLRRRHPIKFLHLSTKVLLTPPDEGPRVKGQRIKLQDIVDGVYVPQRANGSWIDGEHQTHFVRSLRTSSSLSVSLITD